LARWRTEASDGTSDPAITATAAVEIIIFRQNIFSSPQALRAHDPSVTFSRQSSFVTRGRMVEAFLIVRKSATASDKLPNEICS
jgi:hypothetical protein